jgi:hypothetical protein
MSQPSLSVIIRDLDIAGIAISPDKTDPVLIIDANTVLAVTIAFQSLQTVARKRAQVAESLSRIQHAELLERLPGAPLKPPAGSQGKHPFGVAVSEGLDHQTQYNANRYTWRVME